MSVVEHDAGATAASPDGGSTAAAGTGRPGSAERRRGRHTARLVAAVVALMGAGLVALLATRPPATATEVASPLVGRPAPTLAGTTVEGEPFDLAALSGRWVFVNFFASWCPPCQQEEPELVAFAYHHRGAGDAALVSVVFDDTASSARAFQSQAGAAWPTLADPGGAHALDYGVRGPPETFLVSPSGTVVAHFDGPVTRAFLDRWLARAQQGAS